MRISSAFVAGYNYKAHIHYSREITSTGVFTNFRYLEKNPQHWHPNHSVVVKEIENINEIKMAVFFNHTMNFQDFPEKNRRRTELVLEMKRIFEELSIRYDLLPQEVHLRESKAMSSETGK